MFEVYYTLHHSSFLVARGDINPYIERRDVRERRERERERERKRQRNCCLSRDGYGKVRFAGRIILVISDAARQSCKGRRQRAVSGPGSDPRPDSNIVRGSKSALHAHGFRTVILRCCAALRGYYSQMVADTCAVMVRIRGGVRETTKRSDMRAM